MAILHLDQPGDPPLHGVTEVEEQLLFLAEKLPGPPHVDFQLGQVPGRLELLVEDSLEVQRFSMGFMLQLWPGQSRRVMFSAVNQAIILLDLWQGAPSCWKMVVPVLAMD